MLEKDSIERAVWFLRDSAPIIGKARGYMVYCEGNLRRIKSLQMMSMPRADKESMSSLETRAYATDEYKAALDEQQNAIAEYETLRAQREGAVYLIESWRSQNRAQSEGI